MWRAGVFLPAQATHTVHCVSAISRHTADYMTGRSRVTGDGSGIQMTWSCRRQCITIRAPWVGQTDDRIYNITIARHQIYFPTQCHPHRLPGVHQSITQAKQISIAPYMATESDTGHCAQRPPTTNVSHATTAGCQLDYPLIIAYGNSNIGYEIILVSHPYT